MIILVGNKKDLEAEREVTFLEASRFAQENGKRQIIFFTVCEQLAIIFASISQD